MILSTNQFQMTTLYEDADLLVFNKPAGVVVNDSQSVPGETIQGWMSTSLQKTSQEWLASQTDWQPMIPPEFSAEFGNPMEIFQERLGMVHRLDKQTSGVLVWAKNPGSLVNLLAQFRQRQIEKYYLALVHGKVGAPRATLSYPLGRASQDRKMFAVQPDGRPAVTEYTLQKTFSEVQPEVIEAQLWPLVANRPRLATFFKTVHQFKKRFAIYQGFSLLECHPLTGRTHQIRVHLAHIQHPIVGDITYTGKKRQVLDSLWCSRQFLHAERLILRHPRTGEKMEFQAPLPSELEAALAVLA